MSLVKSVRDRLSALVATGPSAPLHRVETAADVLAAQGELRAPVEAWVLGWDTNADAPRNATGPIRQLVKESVMVMIGFLYAGGDGSVVEPEDVEEAIIVALLGWLPPDRAEPLSLRGSRLLRFDGESGTLFRQVVFETSRQRVAA
jgi:hypothetical protein